MRLGARRNTPGVVESGARRHIGNRAQELVKDMWQTKGGLTRSMMPYSLAWKGSKYLGRWMSFAIFSGSLLVCRAISDTCDN